MQTMPPVFVAPVPVIDRPQAVNEIKPPSSAGGSASSGETGNPDARDTRLASERAREIARLIGNRDIDEDQVLIPGLLALDTREVGDQDIIDPNRPAVRGPEPMQTTDPAEALPPLPDELEVTGEVREEAEVIEVFPGSADTEQQADLPQIGPQSRTPDQNLPGHTPGKGAQPASPGASAPDVPEPPEPGNIDIRR